MVICRGKSSNMRLLRPRSCCCVTLADEHAWFHSCQLLQEQDGEAWAVEWLITQTRHSEEWETFPAMTNINYNMTVGVRLWCKSWVRSTVQCDESEEPFLRTSLGCCSRFERLRLERHCAFTPCSRASAFLHGHNWVLPVSYYSVTFHLKWL